MCGLWGASGSCAAGSIAHGAITDLVLDEQLGRALIEK
ncbi:hypothetical protein RA11412_1365 [Rothia aeria]|uniref:Uncharacterized protein n=1 Tax=Rothia aeria TaxID=172042 RepID=A0A2Z5QZL8_9MICC|nr:hypothetical protein RA11412_1365 [Rothia aeria]